VQCVLNLKWLMDFKPLLRTLDVYYFCERFFIQNLLLLLLLSLCSSVASSSEVTRDDDIFPSLLRYAKLANAAYQDVTQVKRVCKEQQLMLAHDTDSVLEKVRYFIAIDHATQTQVVAIRGTANIENAIVDIQYQLQADPHTGIYLHTGFLQATANLYEEIEPLLQKNYSIATTGHSLGGAMALILAMNLDKNGYRVKKVVTFGQPKVTNRAGAAKFDHLPVIRVVTELDLVPIVPPFDLSDIMSFKLDIFWHLGQEYVLLPKTFYSTLTGLDSLLRGLGFLNKQPGEENLNAHRMDSYLDLLQRKAAGSISIPFNQRQKYISSKSLVNG